MASAKDFTKVDFGGNWQDWFIAVQLRREAESLIEGKVATALPTE